MSVELNEPYYLHMFFILLNTVNYSMSAFQINQLGLYKKIIKLCNQADLL